MQNIGEKIKKAISSLTWRQCIGIGTLLIFAAFVVPMFFSAASSVVSAYKDAKIARVPQKESIAESTEAATVQPAEEYSREAVMPEVISPAQAQSEAYTAPEPEEMPAQYAYSYYLPPPEDSPLSETEEHSAQSAYSYYLPPPGNTPEPEVTPAAPPREAWGEEIYIPPVYTPAEETPPPQEFAQYEQYEYTQPDTAVYPIQTPAPEETPVIYSSDELPAYQLQPARDYSELLHAEELSIEGIAAELTQNITANIPDVSTSLEISPEGSIRLFAMPRYGAGAGVLTWNLGPNGFILNADGTESDIYPIEENGTLSCGVRRVTVCLDKNGTLLDSTPSWGSEGVDYFTEDYQEKVELFDSAGNPRPELGLDISNGSSQRSEYRAGWQFINGRVYFFGVDGTPVKGLKKIDGKYYLFDSTGIKASAIGVDVSCFNGYIDWNLLKSEGIDFAIIRVAGRTWGTGSLFEDSSGAGNLIAARAAGLETGAYVYSNAITADEARQEAMLACDVIRKAGVSIVYPLYIDLEHSGEYPNGRADNLGAAQRSEIADVFVQTASSQGIRAGVYASSSYWQDELSYGMLAGYPVWVANYNSSFTNPSYPPHGMWQFSASGRLNGCGELLDLNAIF